MGLKWQVFTWMEVYQSQLAIWFGSSSRLPEGRWVMNDRIKQLSRDGFKIEAQCGETPLVFAMAAIPSIIALGGLFGDLSIITLLTSQMCVLMKRFRCRWWSECGVKNGEKWRLPLIWVMDWHPVNEVTIVRCTTVHYNEYVHELCTHSYSNPEAVMDETLAHPAVSLLGIYITGEFTDGHGHRSHRSPHMSHAAKRGIPIHHKVVNNTGLIYASHTSFLCCSGSPGSSTPPELVGAS